MDQRELWIGLVELKPFDTKAFGAAGAYTSIVTWAADVESFRVNAEQIASKLAMSVVGIEDAESLANRRMKWNLSEEIDDMVLRAQYNPDAIVYGNFYTFPDEVC